MEARAQKQTEWITFIAIFFGSDLSCWITDSVLLIGSFVLLGTDADCSISAQQSSVDHLRSHQRNAINLMPASKLVPSSAAAFENYFLLNAWLRLAPPKTIPMGGIKTEHCYDSCAGAHFHASPSAHAACSVMILPYH